MFLFFSLAVYGSDFTQNGDSTFTVSDSLKVNSNPDSLSTKQDSLRTDKNELDAVVYSSSKDSLVFDIRTKKMFLYNDGKLKYEKTTLTAGEVEVDFKKKDLYARGIIGKDSTGNDALIQTPVLTDRGETYSGKELAYNFKTKRGTIIMAENKQGYKTFRGQKVSKVAEDIYFVRDGIFTTCKGNPPVTYFKAKEMKIIKGDKIIAKWIWMYIGGVPVPLPLPFAVFPIEKGRRSGIVIPTYGQDARRGFYLRGGGYYFALSDYTDLTLLGDLYFKGGFGARSRFRYKKRYNYSGELNLGYSNMSIGEVGDPDYERRTDWEVRWRHAQTFTPNAKLNVNVKYYSSDYLQNNAIDYNNLYRQNVLSNAKFTYRWDGGSSLNLNYYRMQNLTNGDVTEKLPELSYNLPIIYPFAKSGAKKNFYEKIGIHYNSQLRNEHTIKDDVHKWRAGVQHNVSVNASGKIGYFNLTPAITYTEKWYDKYKIIENYIHDVTDEYGNTTPVDSIVEKEVRAFSAVRTFDFRVSTSTKFYGIEQLNKFGVEAFRHTVNPTISYVYKPDFSDEKFGYYGTYEKADGSVVKYDKFSDGIFGGSGYGEQQLLNFSVNNIFEIKTMKNPTDTTSQQKKIKLLNLNLGTSYNFAADSLRLSDLRVSYRTSVGDIFSFSGNSTFTFYDQNGSTKINKFMISEGKGLLRQTSSSFSVNLRLTGEKIKSLTKAENKKDSVESDDFFRSDYSSFRDSRDYMQSEIDETDFSLPWSLNLTYNFGFRKPTPAPGETSSSVGLSLSFNLTRKWKFTMRGNYDFVREEVSAPVFTAYRDLGCWEMFFTWHPIGTYRGFKFSIRLKAPELRDIKLEKSDNIFSGR